MVAVALFETCVYLKHIQQLLMVRFGMKQEGTLLLTKHRLLRSRRFKANRILSLLSRNLKSHSHLSWVIIGFGRLQFACVCASEVRGKDQ